MSDHIGNDDPDFLPSPFCRLNEVIIITAGFIAPDAFACNVKSFYPRVGFGHQILLDHTGLGQRPLDFLKLRLIVRVLAIHVNSALNRLSQSIGRAWLDMELKNAAFIHRFNGRGHIAGTGQHHPHGVGIGLFYPAEKFYAIHTRHEVVGNNHRIGPVFFDLF